MEEEVLATMIDLTGVDLTGALSEVIAMIPVVIPVTIGFIGVRKGLAFLFSSLRKA